MAWGAGRRAWEVSFVHVAKAMQPDLTSPHGQAGTKAAAAVDGVAEQLGDTQTRPSCVSTSEPGHLHKRLKCMVL